MASYTYEFIELGDEHALGCKCCRFSKGVDLPIPKQLSYHEIAKFARQFSASIFKDWSKLNAILKRFEATIQKRWLKKSPKQRREILLKAWPEMPTTHRPDFQGFRKVAKNTPRSHTLPSSAYLWPYINLEDLQLRHHLLLFMNSRGRNLPGTFATTDLHSAHLGNGWFDADKENVYRMGLYGQCTPRTYGELLTVQKAALRKNQVVVHSPIRGLLALEIQERIYGFLLSCARLILHDIKPQQFLLAPFQPTPPAPDADSGGWPSLAALSLETQYLAPQALDVNRLKMIVGSRRAAAEDHLWLLTEDPSYFSEALKEGREHSEVTMDHSCCHCWHHAAERMIGDAFTVFIFWTWIHRQLKKMSTMETQLRRANHDKLRLSPNDEKLWLELFCVIPDILMFPLAMLSRGLKASPRLRNIYYLPKSSLTGMRELKNTPQALTDAERRVDLLFNAIINDEKRDLHGLGHLVAETQNMLDTDAEASHLIDPWVSSVFGDLAMLCELLSRMDNLHPWSSHWFGSDQPLLTNSMKAADDLIDLDLKVRRGLAETFSEGNLDEHLLLANPFDGRFDYPTTKRHTEENVKQMRKAELALDAIWAEVEVCGVQASKISINKVIKNRLLEPRKKHRTPEWIPPLVECAPPSPLTEQSVNIPCFGEGTETTSPVTRAKVKAKIKTHGVASTPPSDPAYATPPATPATPTTRVTAQELEQIKVPKRAYRVLSALFPPPGAAHHQRTEIAWEELLQALNAIGLQPLKLYGSVWIFMPKGEAESRVKVERSIQFHEPKEVRKGSKIPAGMVRTFGRRMKHAFGWVDGMFCCE